MLDKGSGAQQVRGRLASAFEAWEARAPKINTKAQLARLCEMESGRACSPQTVGGWFKTGRMDKMWIPVVEKILSASLGFSAVSPLAQGSDLWPFRRVTAEQFFALPEAVRDMAEAVLIQALASSGEFNTQQLGAHRSGGAG